MNATKPRAEIIRAFHLALEFERLLTTDVVYSRIEERNGDYEPPEPPDFDPQHSPPIHVKRGPNGMLVHTGGGEYRCADECEQGCTGKYNCECQACENCEPIPRSRVQPDWLFIGMWLALAVLVIAGEWL